MVLLGVWGGGRGDVMTGGRVLTTGAGVDFSLLPLLKNTKKIMARPSTTAAAIATKLSSAMLGTRERGKRR